MCVLLALTTACAQDSGVVSNNNKNNKPQESNNFAPGSRPPQYVLIGFDGGLDVAQWQKTRDFAQEMRNSNKPVNFTYFLSGVYFISWDNRQLYAPPKKSVGSSAIGFGKNKAGILNRIEHMNGSFREGHEIASLGNGHFNGRENQWSQEDWSSELKQFNDLVFGSYTNNDLSPAGYTLSQSDIVGFRAPALATNNGLWPALKSAGFKYDVSTVGHKNRWPQKDDNGVWRFIVPEIEVAGTARKTLAMDYNFYVIQSGAKPDVANREAYRKQMYDSYMNYFNSNYYGRRAPVSIGHHFALPNDGAYWDALKDFANTVCGEAEVRCMSYKEYAQFLDALTPETLQSFRIGDFELMPRPDNLAPQAITPDVQLTLQKNQDQILVMTTGADAAEMKTVISVNGKTLSGQKVDLNELRRAVPAGAKAIISAAAFNKEGGEVQRATHSLDRIGTTEEIFATTPQEQLSSTMAVPEASVLIQ